MVLSKAESRYLYICEKGLIHYCSKQRGFPGLPLENHRLKVMKWEYSTSKPFPLIVGYPVPRGGYAGQLACAPEIRLDFPPLGQPEYEGYLDFVPDYRNTMQSKLIRSYLVEGVKLFVLNEAIPNPYLHFCPDTGLICFFLELYGWLCQN